MDETLKFMLKYGMGYTGKLGIKPYIARIEGSDKKYGYNRNFIEPDVVEKEHFNRPRTMVYFHYDLPIGLYEYKQGGDKYIIAISPFNGVLKTMKPSQRRIEEWVEFLDKGYTQNEARLKSRTPTPENQGKTQLPQSKSTPETVEKPSHDKPVKQESTTTLSELQQIHTARSPQSQAMDNAQLHSRVIPHTSPAVNRWQRDPGTADVQGIDTPSVGKKVTPTFRKHKPALKKSAGERNVYGMPGVVQSGRGKGRKRHHKL